MTGRRLTARDCAYWNWSRCYNPKILEPREKAAGQRITSIFCGKDNRLCPFAQLRRARLDDPHKLKQETLFPCTKTKTAT